MEGGALGAIGGLIGAGIAVITFIIVLMALF
jgi:hypothetical protein